MEEIVTVVIPTYKRADRIVRAVDSALHQTITNVEVIVVDDNGKGSIEQIETEKALHEYIDQQLILYVVNEMNSGASFSRNEGLRIAKGKYITFLDDDDEIAENKLEVQAKKLEDLGDSYSCCFCGYHKLLKSGNVYTNGEDCTGEVYLYALARSIYNGSGSNLLVNTNIAREIGGYDVSFKRNQDLEFMVRLVKDYKMAFVEDDLFTIHYEIRENTYSYENNVATDAFYLSKFESEILALPKHKQEAIYKTIALERWRYALRTGNGKDAMKNLRKNHVTVLEFLRYFAYVIHRLVFKKSYGYKFKIK